MKNGPNPGISLRPATEDDISAMLAIEAQNYPEGWKREYFLGELAKPYSRVLVLTDDETDTVIYGYIVYWIQVEGFSLLNVSVDPRFQGMGLGMMLMQAMIREAVADDISRIVLEVRAGNTRAIALYEHIGFVKTHERPKFYDDGETALVMELKTSDISNVVH